MWVTTKAQTGIEQSIDFQGTGNEPKLLEGPKTVISHYTTMELRVLRNKLNLRGSSIEVYNYHIHNTLDKHTVWYIRKQSRVGSRHGTEGQRKLRRSKKFYS